jgi:membrane protease YdiL (CAAX protease family)
MDFPLETSGSQDNPADRADNSAHVTWRFDPNRGFALFVTFASTVCLFAFFGLIGKAISDEHHLLELDRPIHSLAIVSEAEGILARRFDSVPGARVLLRLLTPKQLEAEWDRLILYFHSTDRQALCSTAALARDLVLSGWGHEQARWRVKRSYPNEPGVAVLPAVLQQRAAAILQNREIPAPGSKMFVSAATLIAFLTLMLTIAGLAILLIWFFRGRSQVGLLRDPGIGSFGLLRGYAVLVWGGVLGSGVILILAVASAIGIGKLLWSCVTLVVSLPALILIRQLLLRPLGVGYFRGFGVSGSRYAWRTYLRRRLILVTLALIGIEQSLQWIALTASEMIGAPIPWYEMIYESLLYDSAALVLLEFVDGTITAPIVEEIFFRGICYTSLRSRFRPIYAAALSGVLFGLLHGYGAAGLVALSLSGTASALVYEKTRSLIPCVLAHSFNNFWALSMNLLYRLV